MLIYSNIRPQPIKADSQPDKRRQMSHPASARHSAAQEMDRQVDRSWHEAAVSSPPRDPLTQTPPAMPFNYSLYTIPVAWVLAYAQAPSCFELSLISFHSDRPLRDTQCIPFDVTELSMFH